MKKRLLLLLLFLTGCISQSSPDRCYHLWDPSQKDNCLVLVASETMNISKCAEIEKASLAEQCYSLLLSKGVAANSSICQKLSGAAKDECFSRLAVQSNNPSYCMQMDPNSSYRNNCLLKVAMSLDRPDICESISQNASRNLCKNQIFTNLAVKNKEPQFCEQLVSDDPETRRSSIDNCLFSMAKELNDTRYCNRISNVFAKELCLTGRIDPATCNQIVESQGRQACLYISAVYSKDPNACAYLPDSLRDNCYVQIASSTKNPKVCGFVVTPSLREQCEQLSR